MDKNPMRVWAGEQSWITRRFNQQQQREAERLHVFSTTINNMIDDLRKQGIKDRDIRSWLVANVVNDLKGKSNG